MTGHKGTHSDSTTLQAHRQNWKNNPVEKPLQTSETWEELKEP